MKHQKQSGLLVTVGLGLALIAGFSPAVFNFFIDPYDGNDVVDLGLEKANISEKAHYPLWKMFHYDAESTGLIVLGDSRARALRDKLWHQLGRDDAYNFAYGAATVPEIHDTFLHVKDNPNLKTLVVGLSLRVFNEGHRDNLNRVPEAIELSQNRFQYYTSWFVAKIGWQHLKNRYPETFDRVSSFEPSLVSTAHAADINKSMSLSDLLSPDACIGCDLPSVGAQSLPAPYLHGKWGGHGYGRWGHVWPDIQIERDLQGKFERQVRKNGRSDWKGFKFSGALWVKITEIAEWCDQNNVQLIFVIPPTISDMQARIFEFGLGRMNHEFRLRLSALAPVVDFDFDNTVTRDLENFTDAYHFNAGSAKEIVGELVQLTTTKNSVVRKARKRRGDIVCPVTSADQTATFSDGVTRMAEGKACRIWTQEETQG